MKMTYLERANFFDALNAQPYSTWTDEDDPLLGDNELLDQQQNVLKIDVEQSAEAWNPMPAVPSAADDPRLPQWFLDGAISSIEIAGSARDELGYPRVIRAGQIGVGATCSSPMTPNHKTFWRFVAFNGSGYSPESIAPLRLDLANAEVPHDLIAWSPASRDTARSEYDLLSVRASVRNAARDEMLDRERMLVGQLNESVFVDGRYVDHSDLRETCLVVGIIKGQRARYLSNRPLEVLYALQQGERTPAFLITSTGRHWKDVKVITFYVRLNSPEIVGPSGGLVRVELSAQVLTTQIKTDWSILDGIAAALTQLRTRDASYPRGAVTVEPIRAIEHELHLIFRDTQMAALETLHLFRR
jgi:hypothetical protein